MFSLWKFTTTGSIGRAEQVDKNATHFPKTYTLYTSAKVDNRYIEIIECPEFEGTTRITESNS